MPSNSIRIAGKKRIINGISDHDPYFKNLADDMENEFVKFCETYVSADAVCLDLGANIGIKALALSEIAINGRVFAFEPSPTVYPLLVLNVTENDCRNVFPQQLAVSDADGDIFFHDNSAYGHIISEGGVRVTAKTLNTIIASLQLDRIDLVKIDIEGFEYKVLRSGWEALKRFNPLIYFEFNTWCLIAFSRTDPVAFLEWIFDTFEFVAKVNRGSPDIPFTRLSRGDLMGFLHNNLVVEGCVNDLVVSTQPPTMKVQSPKQQREKLPSIIATLRKVMRRIG